MWVLYNNDGRVITSIPHGEVARQGSSITVYMAFEMEYFHNILGQQSLIYSRTEFIDAILSKIIAQAQFDSFEPVLVTPQLYKFKRIKDNESICSFEEGKTYVVYKFDGGSQYTVDYGDHNLNLTFDFVENEEVVDSQTFGTIPIFLEKTYGGTIQDNTITTEKYNLLLAAVQNMLASKLNIEDEKVKLIETNYESHHKFAEICSQDADREKRDRIYLGKVNGERVLGLSSGGCEVLVLNSTGVIGMSTGSEYVGITFPKLSATDLTAYRLKVDGGLTSPASIVRFTGDITEENNPATKKYVDDLIAYIDDLINERIEEHTDTILNGVGQEGDTLKELFDLIEKNKNIIQVLQEATTKIKHEEEKTEIFQTLEKNYDYSFSSEGITKVSLTIPSDTSQGYLSGFSIKIGSEVPKINFINGSAFPALYTLNGTQRLFSKITFQPNQTLVGALMCDGINVYVYLKEMKNTIYLI